MTAASKPDRWDPLWKANGLQEKQTTQFALRYSLAFVAYASATLSFVHTPAYPDTASRILRSVFERLLQPIVFDYWFLNGVCGRPWQEICNETHASMHEVQQDLYRWEANSSSHSPVDAANIMYSGHLLQVGMLYEAFSGDRSLSTDGFTFGPDFGGHYTLETLLDTVAQIATANAGIGSGVTCEPGSVFPPCQNHLHAAIRLHAALGSGKRPGDLTGISADWVRWAYQQRHAMWGSLVPGNLTRQALLKILRLEPAKPSLQQSVSIPGCAINDAWTLAYLRTYINNATLLADVLQRGADQLLNNPGWTEAKGLLDGMFLESQCLDVDNSAFPRSLGTAFVPLVVAQLPPAHGHVSAPPVSPASTRPQLTAARAKRYLDARYGTWLSQRDMFFHNASEDGMAFQVSATLALASAVSDSSPDVLWRLHGDEGVRVLSRHGQPFLTGVDIQHAQVQRARYFSDQRALEFDLVPLRSRPLRSPWSLQVRGWHKAGMTVHAVQVNNASLPASEWNIVDDTSGIWLRITNSLVKKKCYVVFFVKAL